MLGFQNLRYQFHQQFIYFPQIIHLSYHSIDLHLIQWTFLREISHGTEYTFRIWRCGFLHVITVWLAFIWFSRFLYTRLHMVQSPLLGNWMCGLFWRATAQTNNSLLSCGWSNSLIFFTCCMWLSYSAVEIEIVGRIEFSLGTARSTLTTFFSLVFFW